MPDFPIELIFHKDQRGHCSFLDSLQNIGNPDTVDSINQRNKHVQKLKFFELRNSDDLDDIGGSPLDGLMELKYKIKPPYRAIVYFKGRRLFPLLLMKGSGSQGKINRFVRQNIDALKKMVEEINIKYK